MIMSCTAMRFILYSILTSLTESVQVNSVQLISATLSLSQVVLLILLHTSFVYPTIKHSMTNTGPEGMGVGSGRAGRALALPIIS